MPFISYKQELGIYMVDGSFGYIDIRDAEALETFWIMEKSGSGLTYRRNLSSQED